MRPCFLRLGCSLWIGLYARDRCITEGVTLDAFSPRFGNTSKTRGSSWTYRFNIVHSAYPDTHYLPLPIPGDGHVHRMNLTSINRSPTVYLGPSSGSYGMYTIISKRNSASYPSSRKTPYSKGFTTTKQTIKLC